MDQQLQTKLAVLETKQDERHEVNQTVINRIDDTTSKIWDKLDGLQCQAHDEKLKSTNKRIAGHGKFIFFIITSIITSFLGLAVFIIKGMFT